MWVDYKVIPGQKASHPDFVRDEQFISRIYNFVISNIKETYPYCHGDWALGNIIIDDNLCIEKCIDLHNYLEKLGIEVIVDDRDESAGRKFSDSDLIGFPFTLVVGPRELKNGNVEIRFRKEGKKEIIPYDNFKKVIKNKLFMR